MTTETPQIPQSLHAAMAEWGRHHHAIAQIDAEEGDLSRVVDELRRQLADASTRHAALGRRRQAAADEAELARGMVAHGCRAAGIEMPEQPPAPAALMSVQLPPPSAPLPRDVSGDPLAVPANRLGDPAPPPGADTGPAETVTDPAALEPAPQAEPPAGGDQTGEPGFQPEQPEARRRRGGRRVQ